MASPREQADRAGRGGGWIPQRVRQPDPRVTTYPSDVWHRPDPRVTTYPSDIHPVHQSHYPDHLDPRVTTYPSDVRPRRHHFHDVPPWPHQRYRDYVYVDGGGWWPRWYPYWDQSWYVYWWYLYDYYGGDAAPEYAEYARDAIIRQQAPQWGLVISGMPYVGADPVVRDHRDPRGGGGGGPIVRDHRDQRDDRDHRDRRDDRDHRDRRDDRDRDHRNQRGPTRYPHPHDQYRDYIVANNAWWPQWYPYWDPGWYQYWQQLYDYFGGASQPDYAQYARDAYLRSLRAQYGWR